MTRKAGRIVTGLLAVPAHLLRLVEAPDDVHADEVLVTEIRRASMLTPLPLPRPVAFDAWRLRTIGKTNGQVAQLLRTRLAPKASSRLTPVKRHLANVDKFFATPYGLALRQTLESSDWIKTGAVDAAHIVGSRELNQERAKLNPSSSQSRISVTPSNSQ
jgi:hypothetical protein